MCCAYNIDRSCGRLYSTLTAAVQLYAYRHLRWFVQRMDDMPACAHKNRRHESFPTLHGTTSPLHAHSMSTSTFRHMPICMSTHMPICMSIHMPICMSTHMPICMSTRMPICMSTHMPMYIHIHISIHMSIHGRTCVCMLSKNEQRAVTLTQNRLDESFHRWTTHVRLYVCGLCVCIYICMSACVYSCMCICVHACMYVCMCVCACVRMCACMHVCMHVQGGLGAGGT